ncbi:MAG: holo-ACP synthase [Patescibacteria group bacterium]
MAIRCGTDIVFIPDMIKLFKDELMLKKLFHADELSNPEITSQRTSVSMEHLAGVLAAKEAFFKALGMVPKLHDIQIAYEPSGRPKIVVTPQWQKYKSCDVSISHDHNYAVAMVILEV